MKKIPLATQVPKSLKNEIDAFCEARGTTISHLVTEALQDKLDAMREEEALLNMALERLAEPGERSQKDYQKILKLMK
jgi:predicted DNA-binding protein